MGKEDFKKLLLLLAIAVLFSGGMTAVSVYADDDDDDDDDRNPVIAFLIDQVIPKLDEILAAIEAGLSPETEAQIDNIESEVTNIEGKLDGTVPSLVIDIKTETDKIQMVKDDVGTIKTETNKIQMIKDDVGMIKTTVGGIDTGVTNIEGKLDAIIGKLNTLEIKIRNNTKLDNQYVPFRVHEPNDGFTCVAGEGDTFHAIRIKGDTPDDYLITGITVTPIFPNESIDSFRIEALVVNSRGGPMISEELLNIPSSGGVPVINLMGAPLVAGGTFPYQIASSNGGVIEVLISCDAGNIGDLFIGNWMISGWKKQTQTISIEPFQ